MAGTLARRAPAVVATAVADRVPAFALTLARHGVPELQRAAVTTLQVNLGRLCNLACLHCHVEAGPNRTEVMPHAVAVRLIELLDLNPGVDTLDLTGGAPEMNPSFRYLVAEARRRRRQVIDRCNLTILFREGYEDLPEFLAANQVQVVASLPCYQEANVDKQRGRGTFSESIAALRRLNALGYGMPGSGLRLDLVFNPQGASLPPAQAGLEAQYKAELRRLFDIEFHRLLTITNMPIRRFEATLEREGRQESYLRLLADHFNPGTVEELMCRSLVSVGWGGELYDCDFNQMLEIPLGGHGPAAPATVWNTSSLDALMGRRVATARHCYGCTAGGGSSCSGALA